jgi:hypothetical protein
MDKKPGNQHRKVMIPYHLLRATAASSMSGSVLTKTTGYSVPLHQIMAFQPPYASRPLKMRLDDDESKKYSRQLLKLVNKCLAVDPGARISPQNLLQEVQLKMVGRDGGMMTATGNFPWNHPQAIRMKLEDKYKIGKKPFRPRKLK